MSSKQRGVWIPVDDPDGEDPLLHAEDVESEPEGE